MPINDYASPEALDRAFEAKVKELREALAPEVRELPFDELAERNLLPSKTRIYLDLLYGP